MNRDKIIQIVETLKIPALVHFTQLSNLKSILEKGLMCRNQIDATVKINDELRLDGRPNTISTSIGFPNSRMFYKYRQEKGGQWCVIAISKRILWEKECLFCKYNAADARIAQLSDEDLSSYLALQSMYDEIPELESRANQRLRAYDPTDVQAEVLIKENIPAKFIVGIVFPDTPSKNKHAYLTAKRKVIEHAKNKGFFAARSYVRR